MEYKIVLLICFLAFSFASVIKPQDDLDELEKHITQVGKEIQQVLTEITKLNNNITAANTKLKDIFSGVKKETDGAKKTLNGFTIPFCEQKEKYLNTYNWTEEFTKSYESDYNKLVKPINEIVASLDEVKSKLEKCKSELHDNNTSICVSELKILYTNLQEAWTKVDKEKVIGGVDNLNKAVIGSVTTVTSKIEDRGVTAKSCFEKLSAAKTYLDSIKDSEVSKLLNTITSKQSDSIQKCDQIEKDFKTHVSAAINSQRGKIDSLVKKAKDLHVDIEECTKKSPDWKTFANNAQQNFNSEIEKRNSTAETTVTAYIQQIKQYKTDATHYLEDCADSKCIDDIVTKFSFDKIKDIEKNCLNRISDFNKDVQKVKDESIPNQDTKINAAAQKVIACIELVLSSDKAKIANDIKELKSSLTDVTNTIYQIGNETNVDFLLYKQHVVVAKTKQYNKYSELIDVVEKSFNKFSHHYCTDLEEVFKSLKNKLVTSVEGFNRTYHSISDSCKDIINKKDTILTSFESRLRKCKDGDSTCFQLIRDDIADYIKTTDLSSVTKDMRSNIKQANTIMVNIFSSIEPQGTEVRTCLANLTTSWNNIINSYDYLIPKIEKLNTLINKYDPMAKNVKTEIDNNLTTIAASMTKKIDDLKKEIRDTYTVTALCPDVDSKTEKTKWLAKFDEFAKGGATKIVDQITAAESTLKDSADALKKTCLAKLSECTEYSCLTTLDNDFNKIYGTITTNITDQNTAISKAIKLAVDAAGDHVLGCFRQLFTDAISCLTKLQSEAKDIEDVDKRLNTTIASHVTQVSSQAKGALENTNKEGTTLRGEIQQKLDAAKKAVSEKKLNANREKADSCSKQMEDFDKKVNKVLPDLTSALENTKNSITKANDTMKSTIGLYPNTTKSLEDLGTCRDEKCIIEAAQKSKAKSTLSIGVVEDTTTSAKKTISDVVKQLPDIKAKFGKATTDIDKDKGTVLECLNSSAVYTSSVVLLVFISLAQLLCSIY